MGQKSHSAMKLLTAQAKVLKLIVSNYESSSTCGALDEPKRLVTNKKNRIIRMLKDPPIFRNCPQLTATHSDALPIKITLRHAQNTALQSCPRKRSEDSYGPS